MSWDRFDYTEIAFCACGNGKIIRHAYTEYDDWNRSRDGITSEEIKCDNCSHKYHIEHHVRYYQCHSWDGDGIVDKTYLVPNGITIPNELSKKDFHFKLDEQIVSQFSLTEISAAKSCTGKLVLFDDINETLQIIEEIFGVKYTPNQNEITISINP